jgi:hypothetical protein
MKHRFSAQSVLLAAVLVLMWTAPWASAGAQTAKPDAHSSGIDWVPITFRQDSGTRPFVPVLMNGKPFLMMVHSNAGFYVQTTHENAASIGLTNLGKEANYGIVKDGKVSSLGKTTATVGSLKVGAKEAKDVRLSVFEIPQTVETNGMLGTGWLRDQKVIVDFDQYRVGLPDSIAASEAYDKRLLARGYVGHKMSRDPKRNTWYVMGQVDGHPIRLCVSTVAEIVIDSEWARANGVELGPVIDQQGGPAGALVDESIAKHVLSYTIDGQKVPPAQPVSWDLFGYSSAQRDKEPHDEGFLGADFMLANQAVIDFGTDMLFLAKWNGEK